MDAVVRWAYGQGGRELDEAIATLTGSAADEEQLGGAHAAYDALRAFEAQADRTRTSIEATAQGAAARLPIPRGCCESARSARDRSRRSARRAGDAVPDRRRQGVQAPAADLPGAALGDRRPRLRARDAGRRAARAAAAALPRRGRQRRAAPQPGRDRLHRAQPQHPARLDLPRPRPGPQPLRAPGRDGRQQPPRADAAARAWPTSTRCATSPTWSARRRCARRSRTTGAGSGGGTRTSTRRRRPLVAAEALRQLPERHALLLYGRLAAGRGRVCGCGSPTGGCGAGGIGGAMSWHDPDDPPEEPGGDREDDAGRAGR